MAVQRKGDEIVVTSGAMMVIRIALMLMMAALGYGYSLYEDHEQRIRALERSSAIIERNTQALDRLERTINRIDQESRDKERNR